MSVKSVQEIVCGADKLLILLYSEADVLRKRKYRHQNVSWCFIENICAHCLLNRSWRASSCYWWSIKKSKDTSGLHASHLIIFAAITEVGAKDLTLYKSMAVNGLSLISRVGYVERELI